MLIFSLRGDIMTFSEIISALLPFIAILLAILIPNKWGKPITWLEDLGKYPQPKKKIKKKSKTKSYIVNISLNKSNEK